MRIVVVAGHAPSLVHFRAPLLAALVGRGHEVVALAPPEADNGADNGADTAAVLRGLGVRLLRYPLDRGGVNPVRDASTLWALRKIFLDLKPELVLPYTIKPVIYASLAARWSGVPRVASLITGLGYAFGGLENLLPSGPGALPRRCLTNFVVRLYAKAL